jgi:hypothetical protein
MSDFTKGIWHQGSYFGYCTLDHKHGQGECAYQYTYFNNKEHVSVTKDDGSHCILIGGDEYGDILSKADAQLISAAPDLLEACKRLAGVLHVMGYENDPTAEFARAAIAKATGETP